MDAADLKKLGRSDAGHLYKVGNRKYRTGFGGALFSDPDGDDKKYKVGSLSPNHAIVAAVKVKGDDGTVAVYVEMLVKTIPVFEIIVDVMDNDPDEPLSAPPLTLLVRTSDPKPHTYTVEQKSLALPGLVDGKKVAFRKLMGDQQDTLVFTGGVLFFATADTEEDAVDEVNLVPAAAGTDAVPYVTIETSSNLKFDEADPRQLHEG